MMASESGMAAPLCFIENRPDGEFVVQERAVRVLLSIHQPVVVVAVVGLYRTGKSYLMNRLADKRKGFCLGTTVQAETKGIWMWCLPHPRRPGHTLVLLDTEGLGDVGKADSRNDAWIFALAILLSSTMVYNSMGTIDQNALEKLHYVTELAKKIRVEASSGAEKEAENTAEFVRFFPDFIWTVRDFILELVINGRHVSEDDYLENALKLQHGDTEHVKKCNEPKLCIRTFFPSRKCFVFDRPTNGKKLLRLEEIEEDELDPEFVERASCFCEHVWKTSRPKTVPGGKVVTGTMLAHLAETYVKAINSGDVPCLENAVQVLAEIENAAAVRVAISHYEKLMEERLVSKLPTGTLEELLGVHAACEKEATDKFMARAFGPQDKIETSQINLVQELQQKKDQFCKRNEEASSDCCHTVLRDLSQELEVGISMNLYAVPGGYQCFKEKLTEMVEKYHLVPGKGIQAEKSLEEFLKSKEIISKTILQMDNALTDREKEIEAERARTEAAQQQQKVMEQEQVRMKEFMADQQRSHDEQIQQLNEKMVEEKQKLQEETERMLQIKLKEQEKLMNEGFDQKSRDLQREIQQLKEKSSTLNTVMLGLEKMLQTGAEIYQCRMNAKALGKAFKYFK